MVLDDVVVVAEVMQKKGAVHVFLRLERRSDELNCIY